MNTTITLSVEVRLLVYTAFICLLLWVPHILAVIRHYGLSRATGYPAVDYGELPQWAQRANRAHLNLVENLAPFAVLVLVAQLSGAANEWTVLGARLFFWARMVQVAVHWAGIPMLRTLAFAVGWAGNILIAAQIIGY